ncbi:MAG: transposase [Zoogloea sp.]|nr:transposase [Zoogloea sp.]
MRRSEVPEALADPRTWPGVDVAALSDERRDTFERRERAIYAYLGGSSLASVERETGIHRASVMRLVARCLAPHADGRIQGLRALIPHSRTGQYTRRSPARRRATRGGLSGALGQLFERFPELPRIIEREIAGDRLGMTKNGRLFGLRDVQFKLLATLREAGLKTDEYPLNYDEMGYRALSVWVHRRLEQRVPLRQVGSAAGAWDATSRPYSVVELDGHKLDLRVRVRYIDNTGVSVDIESERLFVVTLIDVATRVVLGWQLVPAPEYDHHDVLSALQDALRPKLRRRDFIIPGIGYHRGAGFVADVMPELNYACWDTLKVDNAASHLSEDTFEPICRFVGCRLEAGPVGSPTVRPFIERFFGSLTERMSRKVHGTTGRHPDDPLGKRGRAVPVALLITLAELEELLDVCIANYHATPHDGLNGRTPLEAMQLAVDHHRTPVRTLPLALRSRLHQLQSVHLATVRGNVARSVAHYVSLYGARYTNEVLQRTSGLSRQRIRVYINPNDVREAWAYLPNGADLGRLYVQDGWRYSRHTLRLRRKILRERRVGKLRFAGEQDPVQIFAESQRRQGKRGRKHGTLELQLQAASQPAPLEPQPRSSEPARPAAAPLLDLSDLKIQNC